MKVFSFAIFSILVTLARADWCTDNAESLAQCVTQSCNLTAVVNVFAPCTLNSSAFPYCSQCQSVFPPNSTFSSGCKIAVFDYLYKSCTGLSITGSICQLFSGYSSDTYAGAADQLARTLCTDGIQPSTFNCAQGCGQGSTQANCKNEVQRFTEANSSNSANCSQYIRRTPTPSPPPAAGEYVAKWQVGFLHSFPRMIGSKTFPTTASSINDPEFVDYAKGVGAAGGFIAGIGLLFALFVSLYLCCCRKDPEEPPSLCKRIVFLFITLLAMTGVIIAGNSESMLITSIQNVKTNANKADDLLAKANKIASEAELVINSTQSNVSGILAVCSKGTVLSTCSALNSALSSAQSAVGQARQGNTLTFSKVTDPIQKFDGYRNLGSLIGLGMVAFPVLVFGLACALVLCCPQKNKKCCTTMAKISVWFLIVILVISWVVSGVMLAIGMFFADVCEKPDTTVIELGSKLGQMEGESLELMKYYISCSGTNAILNQTQNAKGLLFQGANVLKSMPLPALIDCPANITAVVPLVNNLDIDITNGANLVDTQVEPLLQCGTIHEIYVSLIHENLCGTILSGVTNAWIAFFLIGLSCTVGCFMLVNILSPGSGGHNDKVGAYRQDNAMY